MKAHWAFSKILSLFHTVTFELFHMTIERIKGLLQGKNRKKFQTTCSFLLLTTKTKAGISSIDFPMRVLNMSASRFRFPLEKIVLQGIFHSKTEISSSTVSVHDENLHLSFFHFQIPSV